MLTISQFADRSGLSPSALRFYERKGLLVPATRRGNGYRAYAPGQVGEARFISSLRAAGIPISAIREFLRRDGRSREAMLATWRQDMSARLLSLQIADQYLRGLKASQPRVHLEHWAEPSVLVWFPVSAPEGPLPFRPCVPARKKELERRGLTVLTSGYVRTLDLVDGQLTGEVGFRLKPGRRVPQGARRQDVSPTLFATLECTLRDDLAAHRVFRFLDELGFRPDGLHLERYLPGASDRYLLMIAVQRL
ncbi:MerR family transcriptional regulator [Myxococcus sp. RHSTA-1-4]|uniref:MerR family transcriptional regulator n=1 Tax=Myxococcus sp. RHSTA-1-4 TaxID=2874601 RepID=UPI001CBE36C3|nr:MerR family transcriptional regulator [Myxococcus sp. RHSTA-1-4]MBZ4416638.1 MerR family DNA-binding transcriptional regulator [Myxococcus sp. RHSTA-1-4]